jgi:pimeloyl-ACP methyl ester carboxylesterase
MIPNGNNAEMINIQLKNFKEESTGVSQLKCSAKGIKSPLLKMSRIGLGNRIAHYTYELRLGNREFDVVRIHRIVREHSPCHPVRAVSDIFMVHGSIQDFDDIFLTAGAENINTKTSLPVYLASKNIDVWGIDLAWTLVPAETADFTFMKNWGIERDIDHTLTAMSFARLVRGLTTWNFDKMNLFGFSYGVQVAYGAAGRETQIPKVLRHVKGIIPVDAIMKYSPADEEFRINACNLAAATKESIDNGNYQYDAGVTFQFLGNLALTAPDDPSPIPDFAGMTNKQVMLFMGTMTYMTGNPEAPSEHFVGGDLGDLYYSDFSRWLRLAVSLAPYQPQQQLFEFYACMGNAENVSFDDHLGDITLPVLYLGAGGGTGTLGVYTGSLTSSTDITNHIASANENRAIDYGHADLFLGRNADEMVWQVLYNWLLHHSTTHKW